MSIKTNGIIPLPPQSDLIPYWHNPSINKSLSFCLSAYKHDRQTSASLPIVIQKLSAWDVRLCTSHSAQRTILLINSCSITVYFIAHKWSSIVFWLFWIAYKIALMRWISWTLRISTSIEMDMKIPHVFSDYYSKFLNSSMRYKSFSWQYRYLSKE